MLRCKQEAALVMCPVADMSKAFKLILVHGRQDAMAGGKHRSFTGKLRVKIGYIGRGRLGRKDKTV